MKGGEEEQLSPAAETICGAGMVPRLPSTGHLASCYFNANFTKLIVGMIGPGFKEFIILLCSCPDCKYVLNTVRFKKQKPLLANSSMFCVDILI